MFRQPIFKTEKKSSCLYLFRTCVLKHGSYTDDHIDSPPVFLRVKKHFINMKKKIQSWAKVSSLFPLVRSVEEMVQSSQVHIRFNTGSEIINVYTMHKLSLEVFRWLRKYHCKIQHNCRTYILNACNLKKKNSSHLKKKFKIQEESSREAINMSVATKKLRNKGGHKCWV